MGATIHTDQIDRIIWNHHHDPFEVLGPHPIEQNGATVWVVRTYQPQAQSVTLVIPEERLEVAMQSVHHPNFFECVLDRAELNLYQLKIQQGDSAKVVYDPYAFRTPVLTDYDLHLFAEGNHHRIYEKMGAHATAVGCRAYILRCGHRRPGMSP
jgi:1,4-alpha-glucan branching enzyme